MNSIYRFTNTLFLLSFVAVVLLGITSTPALAGKNAVPEGRFELAKVQKDFLQRIQSQWKSTYADHLLQQKIREYAPERKITAFMEALDRAETNGYQLNSAVRPSLSKRDGSISGVVTNGSSHNMVFVFDRYGFLAKSAVADPINGSFTVSNLADGEYYVVARDSEKGWKRSDLVSVVQGSIAADLRLDLSDAVRPSSPPDIETSQLVDDASINGLVTDEENMPLSLAFIFVFDQADTSIAGFTVSDVGFGTYKVDSLKAGSYIGYADSYLRLSISLGGPPVEIIPRRGEYYENALTPDQATPISIAESEQRQNINFSLAAGGGIAGNITNENGVTLDSMFVIAARLDLDNLSGFITENFDVSMGFSDTQGDFVISGLSAGDYILRTISFINPDFAALFEGELGKHAGDVLDEYYGGVQNIFDLDSATPVTVSEFDTTNGINFELDLAGGISGNFVEFSGGGPVMGEGTVIAFNTATGLPELALDFDTLATAYEIRPLPQGNFILFGAVDGEGVNYIPQYYDLEDFDNADPVPVTPPANTENINFTMIRAGAISGTIDLPNGTGASIQTESALEILVVVYNATSGEVAGGTTADTTTFEFLVDGLAPGNYVVEALSAAPGLAATYHGGSTSFTAATPVTVASEDTADANIQVVGGNGIISGTVMTQDSAPIPGVLVIAYDQTGHAVSAGVSGFNTETEEIDPLSGDYIIPGLVDGGYYVRTFSLFEFLLLGEDLGTDADPLTLLLGLFLGGGADLGDIDLTLFADAWYMNEIIELDLDTSSLVELALSLLLSGDDIEALIPFFSPVPVGATEVTVASQGATPNINFTLQEIDVGEIISSVDEPAEGLVPGDFELLQNYPNPFNPSTSITFSVQRTSEVALNIYNVLGQRIRTLFEGVKESGSHTVQWDGKDDRGLRVAGGIYLLRLEAQDQTLSRKMLLVK